LNKFLYEGNHKLTKSMTGYGRGSGSSNGYGFTVEMRSVNHRYADLALRLPRELYSLEDRIRQIIQADVKRGRVEVSVSLDETPAGARSVKVNQDLAAAYYQALLQLSKHLDLPMDAGLNTLVGLPDIFCIRGVVLPEEVIWPSLEEALDEALSRLLQQREDEGGNLARDLRERCRQIREMVRAAAGRSPEVKEECRLRLERKFSDFLSGQFEENRVLMECSLLVDRMGIDEELVRLESHLDSFEKTLVSQGPAGRKLDFIAQEMFREVNTIGSKAGDTQLAALVVDLKSELEKVREQIQNIE
jgi:uncharacterized protein (TIGR00255 family)